MVLGVTGIASLFAVLGAVAGAAVGALTTAAAPAKAGRPGVEGLAFPCGDSRETPGPGRYRRGRISFSPTPVNAMRARTPGF